VFAPSPRQVTPAQVAAIVPHLPPPVEKIGVFVDAALEEIYATVRECGLTGVQLHSDAGPELPAKLHLHLGPQIKILRVVHFEAAAADSAVEQIALHVRNPHIDAVLVDSRTATAVGGTGVPFDWELASTTLFHNEEAQTRLIAAGGLTPLNVAQAIATLRPWGVDVASGVEAAPGKKSQAKVKAFVIQARATELR
jgi:phosphoribosylanthranilate isomerase